MDDFVQNKLVEWGFGEWIERFEEEGIDAESLVCLEDHDIFYVIPKVGPRAKFRKQLKFFKQEQNATQQNKGQQEHEEAADSSRVCPSTSGTNDRRKRHLEDQDEGSRSQSPTNKQRRYTIPGSYSEESILTEVKKKMSDIRGRLQREENTKLKDFLKTKIHDLETDKRELVGVFGRTGVGKSSLINAVIGEKDLLPSGSFTACTTVMIKVEANMCNQKYEAEIEFITTEEWEDELSSLDKSFANREDQENEGDEDDQELKEKLSAVYGQEWKSNSCENFMNLKYFREIPEFLHGTTKKLTCESAKELSEKLVNYTRSESNESDCEEIKRWYWPLVKCVTVRVPKKKLLQHVTLVDLPGNGDKNKSRDEMWKKLVGRCSTVWIVADIDRAASETQSWEILESACSLIGNGGQCQQIHFICTKSDHLINLDDESKDAVHAQILKINTTAKEKVIKEFNKRNQIKKHFSDECLTVFTVSSKEFLKKTNLEPDETEIPKLQEFLQNLNDCHSETLNYVFGAYGILSLIQGATFGNKATKTAVCSQLEEKVRQELDKVKGHIEKTFQAFEKCLNEGVEKSKCSCEAVLRSFIYPKQQSGSAFHGTLRSLVEKNGFHKTKRGKTLNLNETLSSCLTESIDGKFRKTFPNEAKREQFDESIFSVISRFTLDTEKLTENYKDVELQLIFLKTEEENVKTKLLKLIRDQKKIIYHSLTETIRKSMKECYKKAATFEGSGTLENMRVTLQNHIKKSKDTIFLQAKDKMLRLLLKLKEDILWTLEKNLKEAIEHSLKTDDYSIPDFSPEFKLVKQYYSQVKGSPEEERSPTDQTAAQ